MPLAEFLRASKGKVDANQPTASPSNDPSRRHGTDCVELVWEYGQITTHGQSSRARNGPGCNSLQTFITKPQDNGIASGSKTTKLSTMDSVLVDFPLPVPSCEMGLDQDVDMVSWLNYPIDDALHDEYTSDFLRELSGVTISDLPTESHLASREKKSCFLNNINPSAFHNVASLKHGNPSKVPSITEKSARGESGEVTQFSLPVQHNVSKSGISGVTGNNTSNTNHVTSRDSTCNPSSLSDFTSLRLQKLDAGQPSTSSGFTNFPYFSRPVAIARANHLTVNDTNRLGTDDNRCTLSSGAHANSTLVNLSSGCSQKEVISHSGSLLPPINGNSASLPAKPGEEPHSSNRAVYQGDVAMKNASQDQAHETALARAGERNEEPVVATSSVCSGDSLERASNEPAKDLKRKSRDTGESDGPSDEAENESVGARKGTPPRTGAKRSRAAEVHNLSERRRRDRINEKMRALQELIPNCNKVDKASMLDEAIEYLKTLQLQVRMLSMGAGLYMHPMMMPPGMQPIHGAQMPHFSPMGVGMGMGMGMGMGYGMNMLDVNTGMKLIPFQGPHYPVSGTGPGFHVMAGAGLQPFALPGQGLSMPMQRASVLPVSNIPPLKMPMAANASGVAGSTNAAVIPSSSNSKDVTLQGMPKNNVTSSLSPGSNQATNEGTENPPRSHDQVQAVNISSDTPISSIRTDTMPS